MSDKITHITVSNEWLKACGRSNLSGKALEVVSIRDFGPNRKFYTVIINDHEHTWEVWEVRGVTELNLS